MTRIGDFDQSRCYLCGAEITFKRTEGHETELMCDAGIVPFWPGKETRILTLEGEIVHGKLSGPPEKIIGAGWPLHFDRCPARRKERKNGKRTRKG